MTLTILPDLGKSLAYSLSDDLKLRYNPITDLFYFNISNPLEELKFKKYVKNNLKNIQITNNYTTPIDIFNEIIQDYNPPKESIKDLVKYKFTPEIINKLNKNTKAIYEIEYDLFSTEEIEEQVKKLLPCIIQETDNELSKTYFRWFYETLINQEEK